MAWPGSVAPITSCCMNHASRAWVTCSNGAIFATADVTIGGSAWNKLPGELIQISCSTRHGQWIAGVNAAGELWYATQNIVTGPNWKRCTSAPPLKSVSVNSDGSCNVITKDNRALHSRGNITTSNPPFNALVSVPGVPRAFSTIPITYSGWSAVACNNGIYVASAVYDNPKPDWKLVTGGDILDVAFANNGYIMWIHADNKMVGKSAWDSTIFKPVPGKFTHCFYRVDGYFVATTIDNRVVWGVNGELKGENNNGLVDLMVWIPKVVATYPWLSLTNDLSNPNIANINTVYGPQSFIQKLAKAGIKNFAPFKLLTLGDLLNIGRASKVNWMGPNGEDGAGKRQGWDLWVMTFDQEDPYLPLGDVIIKTDQDINKVLCALVKNDPAFSTRINGATDYIQTGHMWKRIEAYWTYTSNYGGVTDVGHRAMSTVRSAAQNTNSRTYKNTDNLILGDVFAGGNMDNSNDGFNNIYFRSIMGIYGNLITVTGTSIKGVNTTVNTNTMTFPIMYRPMAAVNPQYLSLIPNIDPLQNVIVNTYKGGNQYQDWWQLFPTSPFNTFATGGGSGSNQNKLPNGYGYVDLMPGYLVAANCGNAKALTDLGITNKINPIAPVNCQSWMNNYMSKNKYQNITGQPITDWCSQAGSECDDNLSAFCTMGPDGKIYGKNSSGVPSAKAAMTTTDADLLKLYPNSKNQFCGCFMPDDYSIAKDFNKLLGGMPAADAKDFITQSIAAGAYNIPECYSTTCSTNKVQRKSWRTAPGGCKAVQICMNKAVIENAGKITGNINIQQANNCQATTTNAAPTPGAPVKSPADKLLADKAAADKAEADKAAAKDIADKRVAKEAEEASKKQLQKNPPSIVPTNKPSVPVTTASSGMSPMMIAIIIAIILMVIGGGAFFALKK